MLRKKNWKKTSKFSFLKRTKLNFPIQGRRMGNSHKVIQLTKKGNFVKNGIKELSRKGNQLGRKEELTLEEC